MCDAGDIGVGVGVEIDQETGDLAGGSTGRGWGPRGGEAYPRETRLLIAADSGGSNGSRLRLWKLELQKLADETRLRIAVCHFPPGTSKWNKIEHRLFSFISKNWRGKPLTSLQVIVSLIAAPTTPTGLKVHSQLDTASYQPGIKVSDKDVSEINLRRAKFHADWNYEVHPHKHFP